MKLSFYKDLVHAAQYPNGYWHAETEDEAHHANGPDPLAAVASLCRVLEDEVNKK